MGRMRVLSKVYKSLHFCLLTIQKNIKHYSNSRRLSMADQAEIAHTKAHGKQYGKIAHRTQDNNSG